MTDVEMVRAAIRDELARDGTASAFRMARLAMALAATMLMTRGGSDDGRIELLASMHTLLREMDDTPGQPTTAADSRGDDAAHNEGKR